MLMRLRSLLVTISGGLMDLQELMLSILAADKATVSHERPAATSVENMLKHSRITERWHLSGQDT